MQIGERIKAKRKELNLTQEDLASKLGVTFQAVSKWENDTSIPDISLLPKIAKALNTTYDYLLDGLEEECDVAAERAFWGEILGDVTEDIHGDVGKIVGNVKADIYGDVTGNITGSANNIFGNIEGNVVGDIFGNVDGYIAGNLIGTVHGRVKLGVKGKIRGSIIGDGINVDTKTRKKKGDR
ncbi:MAG: helix-turn-helix domain-containing protein [Clostridiales bacterium]|jgi:transcriptional regulator with XRE-family HTH domain|nr:helix-turn-helix domain-containing protein [Clostridiales bacterium]